MWGNGYRHEKIPEFLWTFFPSILGRWRLLTCSVSTLENFQVVKCSILLCFLFAFFWKKDHENFRSTSDCRRSFILDITIYFMIYDLELERTHTDDDDLWSRRFFVQHTANVVIFSVWGDPLELTLKDFWCNLQYFPGKVSARKLKSWKSSPRTQSQTQWLIFFLFTFLPSFSFLYISFAIHFDSICLALFLVIHTSFSQFLLSVQSIFLVGNLFSSLFCTHKFLLFTCSLLGSSPHHETQRLSVRAVVELHFIKKC